MSETKECHKLACVTSEKADRSTKETFTDIEDSCKKDHHILYETPKGNSNIVKHSQQNHIFPNSSLQEKNEKEQKNENELYEFDQRFLFLPSFSRSSSIADSSSNSFERYCRSSFSAFSASCSSIDNNSIKKSSTRASFQLSSFSSPPLFKTRFPRSRSLISQKKREKNNYRASVSVSSIDSYPDSLQAGSFNHLNKEIVYKRKGKSLAATCRDKVLKQLITKNEDTKAKNINWTPINNTSNHHYDSEYICKTPSINEENKLSNNSSGKVCIPSLSECMKIQNSSCTKGASVLKVDRNSNQHLKSEVSKYKTSRETVTKETAFGRRDLKENCTVKTVYTTSTKSTQTQSSTSSRLDLKLQKLLIPHLT